MECQNYSRGAYFTETKQTVKILRFEDLKVWQLAHQLSIDVARLVKTFPKDERHDLAGQMRRSARSLPSDISEGFGRFHFNDKLTFYERARASLGELRNHFEEALGNKYVDGDCYKRFHKKINEVGYLLNRLMKGVRAARDSHENGKRLKKGSSPALRDSLACRSFLAKAALPSRRDKFQRETLSSIHAVNNVSKKDQID